MRSLETIDEWPVGIAAAAALNNDSTLESYGPTDHRFALASISKVLSAVAVHVAIEEEVIAIGDVAAGAPAGATIAHLLNHSSGLAPDSAESLAAPGKKRIYSNYGFELATQHVATQSTIDFADYLSEAVFAPAAMGSTELQGSPAHGIVSTVEDLVLFLQALHQGWILAPETLQAMISPSGGDLPGVLPGYGRQNRNSWGLGVEIRGDKSPHWTAEQNSASTWGHFGRSGTFIWVDPIRERSLICLTDRLFGDWALERWPALSSNFLEST
ncbi:MAG: serine hydrolase domain-containing protein [Acidimicrobiales bacterium]